MNHFGKFILAKGAPRIALRGFERIHLGGGQPDTGAPGATAHFHVDGQHALPE